MPQPQAGVEKPQPIVVLHDCRIAGVILSREDLYRKKVPEQFDLRYDHAKAVV